MAGIAGIESQGKERMVSRMLERIEQRGPDGRKVIQPAEATLGAVWPRVQANPTPPGLTKTTVWDSSQPPDTDDEKLKTFLEPYAVATMTLEGLFLARDPLGVKPLYVGKDQQGMLVFASEVKALMQATSSISEFPPGHSYTHSEGYRPNFALEPFDQSTRNATQIAAELRSRLEQAVARRVDRDVMGCWLSGGLDSSAMAALARTRVRTLHTFAGGLPEAPDVIHARQVAEYLKTEHHEIIVSPEELILLVPRVIYSLESFDALLVRSSIVNFLVAAKASQYVDSAFSGEGGDELFAGYAYLKDLPAEQLPDELVDIMQRLHNTALQRVDRSASANSIVAHVPFLDPQVVECALGIPARLKLHHNGGAVEKWILRKALEDLLPDEILWRPKSKFWEGAGVQDFLAEYAEKEVSDHDFNRERRLSNGWILNSKEELYYFRVFREYFGSLDDFSWMGRTKGAPMQ
jgi:asparagine synthase (glutamine-hydrolysing)